MLVVERVDLVQLDEVLDVDRAGLLRGERLELLRRDHDVAVGAHLEALDDVLVGHFLAVGGTDALLLDPRPVGVVELVEPDRLLLNRAVQLDRHVHQAEADCAFPNRSRHSNPL